MKQYIDLVERIIKEGHQSDDRTGTGTIKIFGHQSTYNMDDGFPLLTLKNTWMPGVTHELLWLLGCHMKDEKYSNLSLTNIKYLVDNKVHIWDEWADDNGDLGPVYGQQWVDWKPLKNYVFKPEGINQIQIVIDKLTKGHKNFNPMDRGLVVSAWNVGDLDQMALRPCHAFFQFQSRELSIDERMSTLTMDARKTWRIEESHDYLDTNTNVPKYELSLQLYQRSADTFLGVPFNIASYSLLLHMVCHVTGMKPGKFVHTFGDAHLYSNHKEQVNMLLSRTFNPTANSEEFVEGELFDFYNSNNKESGLYYGPKLPSIWLNPEIKDIFDFQFDDIKVLDYKPLPAIKAPVAI